MQQALILVDFVRFDAVLVGQSQNAILSRSDVRAAKIDPLGFFVLGGKKKGKRQLENESIVKKWQVVCCSQWCVCQ